MYRILGGINTDSDGAGYKKIIIKPYLLGQFLEADYSYDRDPMYALPKVKRVSKSLTYVQTDIQSYYGRISNNWKIADGQVSMQIEIPANTNAIIYLPTNKPSTIKESGAFIHNNLKDITIKERSEDFTSILVGSGKYDFIFPLFDK